MLITPMNIKFCFMHIQCGRMHGPTGHLSKSNLFATPLAQGKARNVFFVKMHASEARFLDIFVRHVETGNCRIRNGRGC